ncbi:MAG: ATP-binding cassette domain-containing protein [Alphaproteobacteria bacterium]
MTGSLLPLRVQDLTFEAGGKRLLEAFSFELSAASRSIILGPNGAGKSLTLRLCHGLLEPASGSVTWLGGGDDARSRQAMVFQRPVMLRRSAAANVAYALACRGVPRRRRAALIEEALDKTGLGQLAGASARVLSAGEQQRLALARVWALRPEVLFLDEPTANLDPAATAAVEGIILGIHGAGTKIIMTTHDLGQARRLAQDVLFLYQGRLLEHSPAERFFAGPATPEGRAFIAGELIAA